MKKVLRTKFLKGGLLSDLVTGERLEEIQTAGDINEPAATDASGLVVDATITDATTNVIDANEGCKTPKASNQNDEADAIGMEEPTLAPESVAVIETADTFIDNADEAFTDIEDITEQKAIIDEAAQAGNLSMTAVLIFKANCENYLQKTNGANGGKFNGKYLDPDTSGLQSDSQESLKAGLQGVWDSVVQAIQSVAASISKGFANLDTSLMNIVADSATKAAALARSNQFTDFKDKLKENGASGKLMLEKKKINNFVNLNYVAFSVASSTNRVDGKSLLEMLAMFAEYIKVDKLPTIKATDNGLEVGSIDSGSMPKLEQIMSKFFLDKVIKNPIDKTSKFVQKNVLKACEEKGIALNDIKENTVRTYSIFGTTVWAIIYTPDGKNFLANPGYVADKNFWFKRSENIQTEADIVNLSYGELDKVLTNVVKFMESEVKTLVNSQRKKINDLKKFSEQEIKKMEQAAKNGDTSNMKVWKQRKQDVLDIWRIYPSLVFLSNNEAIAQADRIANLIASAKPQKD